MLRLKRILMTLVALCMCVCMLYGGSAAAESIPKVAQELPSPEHNEPGWYKSEGSWYFNYYSIWASDWAYIDYGWYYFDPHTARMMTGWQHIRGEWYYLGSDGRMRTGWHYLKWNGKSNWYYFDKSNGHMYANTRVDGYWLNASGARAKKK